MQPSKPRCKFVLGVTQARFLNIDMNTYGQYLPIVLVRNRPLDLSTRLYRDMKNNVHITNIFNKYRPWIEVNGPRQAQLCNL